MSDEGLSAVLWKIEHGAILGDDRVEAAQITGHALQVAHTTAGDQDHREATKPEFANGDPHRVIESIVDGDGLTVREVKVSTEPEAIRSAVEGCADRLDRVGGRGVIARLLAVSRIATSWTSDDCRRSAPYARFAFDNAQ